MIILSKNHNNTSIALFSSLLAIGLSALCLYMRKEFATDYENILLILGFGLLCINISSLHFFSKLSFNRSQVSSLFICLTLPLLISWIDQYYCRYVFLIGYILFALTIWKSFRVRFWSFLFLLFALGATFFHIIPSLLNNDINYINPLFFEALQLGKVHIDTLFHSSIANMIQTYNTTSTGVDGLVPLNYHVGSHYYLAHFSKILKESSLLGYNFVFIIVFIPLFIYIYLSTIRSVSEKFNIKQKFNFIFWIAFIIVTFSLLSDLGKFGKDVFLFHILSESYNFAFILFCLFIILFIEEDKKFISDKKQSILFIVATVFFLLASLSLKISVGFLFWVAVIYLCFRFFLLNKNTYLRIKLVLFIGVLFITFYFGYKINHSNTNSDIMNISLFNFIKEHINYLSQKLYFYLIHFFWGIAYCILRIRDSKIYTLKNLLKHTNFVLIDIELLIVLMIASSLPGMLIAIPDGSAIYFTLVARQLGMILFLAYIVLHQEHIYYFFKTYIFTKNDISFGLIFSVFMAITIFGGIAWKFQADLRAAYSNHKNLVQDYKQLENSQINSTPIDRNWAVYITKQLDSLGNLPIEQKRKLVIHISQSDTLFWKHMNTKRAAKSISFVVPAISGIMQIDGMPLYGEEINNYGFADFVERKNSSDTLSYSQMCIKAQKYIPIVEKLIIYYPSNQAKKEISCEIKLEKN
ncbi:hypothetical protein V9L05_00230 [Bernardetia sp. Wsw4-3y2]|uniref:hypothetical protein n=1 Tax=Bernardetia sp. Wsw4-3y2 TaxID=3127471 RepID=UPI0030D5CFEE